MMAFKPCVKGLRRVPRHPRRKSQTSRFQWNELYIGVDERLRNLFRGSCAIRETPGSKPATGRPRPYCWATSAGLTSRGRRWQRGLGRPKRCRTKRGWSRLREPGAVSCCPDTRPRSPFRFRGMRQTARSRRRRRHESRPLRLSPWSRVALRSGVAFASYLSRRSGSSGLTPGASFAFGTDGPLLPFGPGGSGLGLRAVPVAKAEQQQRGRAHKNSSDLLHVLPSLHFAQTWISWAPIYAAGKLFSSNCI